jgi:hypothetical protein
MNFLRLRKILGGVVLMSSSKAKSESENGYGFWALLARDLLVVSIVLSVANIV